ncbi:hypothetical protein MMC28_008243 [Mycoblastus sanguinarius]|nr:hypothetical protein [Mycoblastus sanguinarius]
MAAFLIFLLVGAISFVHVKAVSGAVRSSQLSQHLRLRKPSSIYFSFLILIIFLGYSQYQEPQVLDNHPIDLLIRKGRVQWQTWYRQASTSESLAESAAEYQIRYQRHPPPGFDAWYRYAKERSSIIIDDYDSIVGDLQPFWGISPSQIRLRTQEVVSDPWNDVAGLIIRNGRGYLGPNFKPTHRWILDGILALIKDFSQFLPDMELAFNLNDEPRVAVPYRIFQKLQDIGASTKPTDLNSKNVLNTWSRDREEALKRPEGSKPVRKFGDQPRINSFSAASIACPPNSSARKAGVWDARNLCTSCAAPHSDGVFVSNWTLSASPCHQADLSNLHGFYLSPAAFKTSHELLPIFSQSKADGFADILYPSPWNYADKVKYASDPDTHPDRPFDKKEDTLFWRGSASEGVSQHGTWKGMMRQRLVHLANNLTTSSRSPTLPILLPHPTIPGKYSYQTLPSPISDLNLFLNISIVNITRAWDSDGAAQLAEFGLVPPTHFQDHWRYRYLLDMDGAGYSSRFLPFLQSRSLPFRAGIFRAWYDSRLTAWKHFIPIDIRLHGLFSTLAYFMGTRPQGKGRGHGMEANLDAGREIADAGREWAERVLRKEDMEVYMFRLLLEWGRLTDDRRDEIGFTG